MFDILQKLLDAERSYRHALDACRLQAGALFREYRRARGWKQAEMAERLRMSNTYLSRVENGKSIPGRLILLRLARIVVYSPSIEDLDEHIPHCDD